MDVKLAGFGFCASQVAHCMPTSNQIPLLIVASVHIDGRVEQVRSAPAPVEIYTGEPVPRRAAWGEYDEKPGVCV